MDFSIGPIFDSVAVLGLLACSVAGRTSGASGTSGAAICRSIFLASATGKDNANSTNGEQDRKNLLHNLHLQILNLPDC